MEAAVARGNQALTPYIPSEVPRTQQLGQQVSTNVMTRSVLRWVLLVGIGLWPPIAELRAAEKLPCSNLRSAADCAREGALAGAHAREVAVLEDKAGEAQSSADVVRLEKLEIVPAPEDRDAPQLNRWEKMERALGPGKSARREWVETFDNTGVRMACMKPCPTPLCCIKSGEFSLAHPTAPGAF